MKDTASTKINTKIKGNQKNRETASKKKKEKDSLNKNKRGKKRKTQPPQQQKGIQKREKDTD
jgi:hypothetical protein